mgnify:CR=1 FL=1
MKVYRGLDNLPVFDKPVITIGSFDGVHYGHQKLLERIKTEAAKLNKETIVITFDPHPRQIVFPKDNSLQLLNTTPERITLFENFGIDHLVIVPFTVAFSQQAADEYIENFLVKNFQPSIIVIGYDHKFGLARSGDINFLKWHEEKLGYKVKEIDAEQISDIIISSTKIRNFLLAGDIKQANSLLGYHYILSGEVKHGEKIGHQLGFPTANIYIDNTHKLIPKYGVYASKATVNGKIYQSMLYIGDRPSYRHLPNRTIEVNIFDFEDDIYGQEIKVEIVDFIRDDIRFDSQDELIKQLNLDKQSAVSILQV